MTRRYLDQEELEELRLLRLADQEAARRAADGFSISVRKLCDAFVAFGEALRRMKLS